MTDRKNILIILALWVVGLTALHLVLNVNFAILLNDQLPLDKRKLNVAYIPVT